MFNVITLFHSISHKHLFILFFLLLNVLLIIISGTMFLLLLLFLSHLATLYPLSRNFENSFLSSLVLSLPFSFHFHSSHTCQVLLLLYISRRESLSIQKCANVWLRSHVLVVYECFLQYQRAELRTVYACRQTRYV